MNRHSAIPPAQNHWAMAHDKAPEPVATGYEAHIAEYDAAWRNWPMLWSPSYFVPVVTASGRTIWQQQPSKLMRLLPPELEALLPTEGELAKAVRQLRVDEDATEGSSFRESGC